MKSKLAGPKIQTSCKARIKTSTNLLNILQTYIPLKEVEAFLGLIKVGSVVDEIVVFTMPSQLLISGAYVKGRENDLRTGEQDRMRKMPRSTTPKGVSLIVGTSVIRFGIPLHNLQSHASLPDV